MAYFLFIDESGHDRQEAPYEVLAGVAVRDRDLWRLIKQLHAAEIEHFGRRYSAGRDELKGKKLLKTKVFRHTELNCGSIPPVNIPGLAKAALDDGANANIFQIKALALAKLAYVTAVFQLCSDYNCRAFASIVESNAHRTVLDGLRKDYAYLFQRFFYFLEDETDSEQGIVVFDELEKSRSHVLIDQTHKYFKETGVGRERATLIVPEPLFVHSDLTTGIQIADLIAYCVSWAFRTNRITKPARPELASYATQVACLRHRTERFLYGQTRTIWSFAHITDLRTQTEREMEGAEEP